MQAIILAAGMGRRLGELTGGNTKCMVMVNNKRLINRALDVITSQTEISKIVIVVGYKAENVKNHIGTQYNGVEVVYVDNPIYDRTNNIYSLYLAKDFLTASDTILLESDLIFEERIFSKLINSAEPNVALVDKYESWMDGTVVTIDNDNYIKTFISKKYFDWKDIPNYYKTVNIYKFSKEFSTSHYVPMLEAYSQALGNNEYYEQVLRVISLMDNTAIKALPLNGEKWYEIDDIQDLDIAKSMFLETDNEQWEAYTSRYGGYWRYPKLLDFCYLVNPYFPTNGMINEMKANFEVLLREYPSGMAVNSLLAAKYFGLSTEYTVVGNGAAELIKSYIERYTKKLGVVYPTFEEYPNRKLKTDIIRYIPPTDGFVYGIDEYMIFFENSDADTLLLINPDNPSGNYIPFCDLLTLIEWSKKVGKKLIVDESFVDFADVDGKSSLLDNSILANNTHLIVIKSISKSYGVPGLRLGILASADLDLISRLKKDVAIWNINSFGEFYMQIFGKYEKDYQKACKLFIQERKSFYKALTEIPFLKVFQSQANYFMCEVIGTQFTSKELAMQLLKENILIKDCSGKDGFCDRQYIRLAIRDKVDNQRLIDNLKAYIR